MRIKIASIQLAMRNAKIYSLIDPLSRPQLTPILANRSPNTPCYAPDAVVSENCGK